MTNDIARLHEAIQQLHDCGSQHIQSVAVKEYFLGQVVWDGLVEHFALIKHPAATECYAWMSRNDDGSDQFTAVLKLPPVDSAKKAVRAAIIASRKSR